MGELKARYTAFCAAYPPTRALCAGHEWTYRESGPRDAPLVVLLPGALGRPETSFEYITSLTPCLRVIAPDYPAAANSLNALCDGIATLLDELKVVRAHIVGGSFGGLVAQAFLRRYPERVARLVLSDTSPPVPFRALRMRVAAALIHRLPERTLRAFLAVGVGRYVAALPEPARHFWNNHFKEMLATLGKGEIENRARIWAEFDQTSAALMPRRETLILCAKSDRAVSPLRFQEHFPQAIMHLVASPLGHAASIGDAPAYIEPIRRFLTGGNK